MEVQSSEADAGGEGLVGSLREIQGEYARINDMHETEMNYALEVSEMMKVLQEEVGAPIQIKPEAMDAPYRAVYLLSEAVIVTFDLYGKMASTPLYRLPANVIVSVIEDCAPKLLRLLAEKRKAERGTMKSLERVLWELGKASQSISGSWQT
jgi:hypothetical protein